MARSSINEEVAGRLRDDLTIEVQTLVAQDSDALRAYNVNDAVYRYGKIRIALLKYVAERKQ